MAEINNIPMDHLNYKLSRGRCYFLYIVVKAVFFIKSKQRSENKLKFKKIYNKNKDSQFNFIY